MTSSKFSKRPRVQPEPKACKVGPTPLPPTPPPPPPPWPPLTLESTIDWDEPDPPGDFKIHEAPTLTWYSGPKHWFAVAPPVDPTAAEIRIHLNLDTGQAYAALIGRKAAYPKWYPYSDPFTLTPGEHFNTTISTWNALPAGHTCTLTFHT